jgi:hypothetical protein
MFESWYGYWSLAGDRLIIAGERAGRYPARSQNIGGTSRKRGCRIEMGFQSGTTNLVPVDAVKSEMLRWAELVCNRTRKYITKKSSKGLFRKVSGQSGGPI